MSNLTLHGIPGSGKTRAVNGLLQMLTDHEHLSTGRIAREIAKQYGFGPEEFNLFPAYAREHNIPYDSLIDQKLQQAAAAKKMIIDCRLGYFFIPESYKVLLTISLRKAAERIYEDVSRPESAKFRPDVTIDVIESELKEREQSDSSKYLELYGTDYTNINHYDLVIDTGKSENDVPFVINKIHNAYLAWKAEKSKILV